MGPWRARPLRTSGRRHGGLGVLAAVGIDPALCCSGPTWWEFLTARAEGLIACGFLRIGLVGLRRVCALVFLEHGTRRLHSVGVAARLCGQWAVHQVRHLVVELGLRLESLCFLVRERDAKYAESFDAVFAAGGIGGMWAVSRACGMSGTR